MLGLLLAFAGAGVCSAQIIDATPEDAGLRKPRGLVVHQGTLWVADTDNGRVVGLPILEGGKLGSPARIIDGLAEPFDVTARDGMLYVAESAGGRVSAFEAHTGRRSGAWAVPAPRGVHVLGEGKLAVTGATDPASGALFALQIGTQAAQTLTADRLVQPWGITGGPDGPLFVADAQGKRIVRIRLDGTPDGEIKTDGKHLLTALLRMGDLLLVAQSTAHRVAVLGMPDGAVRATIPTGSSTYPQGLAADGAGHLFIALTGLHAIGMVPTAQVRKLGAAEGLGTQRQAPTEAPSANGPRIIQRKRLVVVALGDSVTQGVHMQPGETYPAQLQSLLDARYGAGVARVINAGIGGNTSSQGLARLQTDVLSHKPDFVLVNFGLNDSAKTGPDAYKTAPDLYEANLTRIVTRVREAKGEPVLSTITPVIEELYFQRHPREYYELEGGLAGLLSRYNAIVRQVARRSNVAVADWRRALEGGEEYLIRTPSNCGAPDGVHPTCEGYRALALEGLLRLRDLLER